MFSLIITIISIALVAALALATLYYGGTAFNKGSANADAAKLINEGQQVNGAVTLYRADFGSGAYTTAVTDVAGLVAGTYLSQVPAGLDGASTIASGKVMSVAAPTDDVCKAIEVKAGRDDTLDTTEPAGMFGCWADTGVNKFFYKF